jgi:hypothetical protein
MNMTIEVEKPAAITLPVTAQNVIIVNNALSQPAGYGLKAPSGKYPEDDSVYLKTLKTASWQVITETFNYLDNSKFFSDVSLYKKALREDEEWLSWIPLKEEVKKDFLEKEHFDLLISIDRLLFNSAHSNVAEVGRINVLLTFSAYLRDNDKPLVGKMTITDTVIAFSAPDYYPSHDSYENQMSQMIRFSSLRLGEKLGSFFAPTWDTKERIYYIKNVNDAIQTSNYIKNETWTEAKTAWTSAFETTKKPVHKAKLATNIALACEMSDDFGAAETWAKEAKTLFLSASSTKYAKEIKYLNEYIENLQERRRNNILLNKQYGLQE